jgi:hypothetical protein
MMISLPQTAVQLIQQLAVGRRVPGTSGYARVCRTWRAASENWDWEPLRLLLDLDTLNEQQLSNAILWLTTHGGRVQHLGIKAYQQPASPVLQQLWAAPMACLTRLEVDVEWQYENTLLDLAPLLPQLPRLQHLKASITIMGEQQQEEEEDHFPTMDGDGFGFFCTAGMQQQPLPAVPVLEELCPQLQGLHLVINGDSDPDSGSCWWMDPRLCMLLPFGLQQLHLEVVGRPVLLDTADLVGCTALQELTLQNLKLRGAEALADTSSLTTVRIVDVLMPEKVLLSLSSKLVQYTSRGHLYWKDPQVPGQLTALTTLTIRHSVRTSFGQYNLSNLSTLWSLELNMRFGSNVRLPLLLQQLAGLPQLRLLRLAGFCISQHITGVTALQQLTGLTINGLLHLNLGATCVGQQAPGVGPWPDLLPQLPGLQRLEVEQDVVTGCHQPWWTGLTALTQLVVVARSSAAVADIEAALAAGTVPASLKQLVVKVELSWDEWQAQGPGLSVRASILAGVEVVVWKLRDIMSHKIMYELPPAVTPCPWLPGVWEVSEGP